MSSEENESIISVCVNTSPFAEDLVSALLESVFQSTPSVWSDLDANKSKNLNVDKYHGSILFKPAFIPHLMLELDKKVRDACHLYNTDYFAPNERVESVKALKEAYDDES